MAILVDFNPLFISNFMVQVGLDLDGIYYESLCRNMILKALLAHKKKFSKDYGEMIICADGRRSWRNIAFPHYKARRALKKDTEENKAKWQTLHLAMDKIGQELKDQFPFRFLKVEHAEADDIVAVLTMALSKKGQRVVIISNDKDFAQLLKHDGVVQWAPKDKDFIKVDDPDKHLKEMIIRGDDCDDIPNIFSPNNVFITKGISSKRIYTKKLNEWLDQDPQCFCEDEDESVTEKNLQRYAENTKLIDFRHIPKPVVTSIIDEYKAQANKPQVKYSYFADSGLVEFITRISEFNS